MRLVPPLLALLTIAACDRGADPADDTTRTPALAAPVSDELPDLPAAATGIDFWDHPSLAFNGLMIAATAEGVIAYSMEDGSEVSRIDGFNAQGLATGYLGFDNAAAGFVAFLDNEESRFRFYGVDNQSRAFLPLDAGPDIRGAVRGFCLGRGEGVFAPTLFVVQNGEIQVFNLAGDEDGVRIESEARLDAPDNLVSCAVDHDGALLVAADDGAIYKLAGDNAFAAPFAEGVIGAVGDLKLVPAAQQDAPDAAHLFLADLETGAVHVFDGETGKALGAVTLEGTDSLPGVGKALSFGATGANLGALYRDGVIAFGVEGGEAGPSVRIAPASTVKNALSLPLGEPVSPRGDAPAVEDEGLIIPTNFEPN